jgi:hypothetical protein
MRIPPGHEICYTMSLLAEGLVMRVLALAVLVGALPAAAAPVIITGTVYPQAGNSELSLLIGRVDVSAAGQGVGDIGDGIWRASFAFSRPATARLFLGQVITFDEYDLYDGSYLGGDDFFNLQAEPMFGGSSGSGVFRVWRGYQSIIPGYSITYHGFLGGAGLDANFGILASPVDYTFRVDRIGDVPEPASWVMLVAGFGLVGAIHRRRRAATGRALA